MPSSAAYFDFLPFSSPLRCHAMPHLFSFTPVITARSARQPFFHFFPPLSFRCRFLRFSFRYMMPPSIAAFSFQPPATIFFARLSRRCRLF
jgi:hypothetical protein